MTTLTASRLITSRGIVDAPEIVVDDDGLIASIQSDSRGGGEGTLAPAFFDIHIHGAAGHDVMEGTSEAFAAIGTFLATRGVAHFLATTVTAPVDATLQSLEGIAGAIDAFDAIVHESDTSNAAPFARPVGIHLEGPFISHAKRGVHPQSEIQPPSIALFERMQQAARGHIKLMTIAPEVPGALELIEFATKSGTKVSMGHSNANAAETRAAIAAGACSATHTFNAMRPLEPREPGIAGVVLDDSNLFAELICDGTHVSPEFVRMWLRAKGPAHAMLVTDGISATGMSDGSYMLGQLEVTVANGRCLLASAVARGKETLAGSVLTMDRAVANLQRFTGANLEVAVHLAGRNPASMLGLCHLTEIAEGMPANFNLYSSDGTLAQTFLRGRCALPTGG